MDDKIYELMAQAEILQDHALALQNKASEAISEIPEAIDEAKETIRSTSLWCAIIFLLFGLLITVGIFFAINWSTDRLREEKISLQIQVNELENKILDEDDRLAKIRSKTWDIRLFEKYGKRWIKLKKGDKVGKTVGWEDGGEGIEIVR